MTNGIAHGLPQDRRPISLFLCGDVMTGRGIDQVLPHPVNPILYEPYLRDAREYVELAETAHGSIPRPVGFDYIWGDALEELEHARTDSRIINLETSITTAEEAFPKAINYRMNPANVGCIMTARIDCCCLANNHILDWGYTGIEERSLPWTWRACIMPALDARLRRHAHL